jgi:CDP-4-dehydro-6-deoxyglucose reductase
MTEQKSGGIPRDRIPWHPTIIADRCTKCGVCVSFCHQGVYADSEDGPVVKNPLGCIVGCTGCANECPAEAISFPTLVELRDTLARLRKEYGVLRG